MGWQVVYVPFLFAGNTIIESKGVFVYSGTPTLGNLIASIASTAGVDDFGNVVQAGTTSYVTISGTTYAVGLNALSGTGLPGLSMGDIAHAPTAVAGFFGEASSSVTPQAFAAITSGQATAADVASFISILSQIQSGVTGGQIVLQAGIVQHDIAGNLVNYSATGNAVPQYTGPSDGNGYRYGTARNYVGSTININSTSPIVIVGLPVAAIQYRVHGQIIYVGGAVAASAVIGWDGSATVSAAQGTIRRARNSTNVDNVFAFNQTSAIGNLTLAFNAAELETYEIDGTLSFSAGGVFNIRGQESVAGDNWTVATGSYLELEPVA